ncbi:methyltransferase domain-containing protein [Geobacter argillaceus]|uniref:CheR-type MCP methyltransferase n=1 Tax=Geobacter argillaceus TaxID=345631 RepID=A0A562WU26_9BACT|nr:chemotaxis protein CheR [Geobacter argillaceus]TWJ33512.1 CheR-type MCP methyltransferase [Geobacter argillaceus]
MGLSYCPTIEAKELQRRLRALLVTDSIMDTDLERRLARLELQYRLYAATCPVSLWAPGLVLTNELVNQAERYLPVAEIARTFRRFSRLAMTGPTPSDPLVFHGATGWLPVLQRLGWPLTDANPAGLLRALHSDRERRVGLLFSLYLPERHGGGFSRYPGQLQALRDWLAVRSGQKGMVRCLDAACGTGEGTWDLAEALLATGLPREQVMITGLTLGALELFAAAHAFFPQDRERQHAYRERITQLMASGMSKRMLFRQADLRACEDLGGDYSAILCNGLLGGPMLHDRESVGRVVKGLAASLEPGGILLAADRFHAGWRKLFPREQLAELFVLCGLRLVAGGEGIAGIRI